MHKENTDIYQILELEYLSSERGSGVATEHLKARIARRPGKWRKRMQSRWPRLDEELSPYDEAA